MNSTFSRCVSLTNIEGLSNWKTKLIMQMIGTFHECISLISFAPVQKWELPKIEKYNLLI